MGKRLVCMTRLKDLSLGWSFYVNDNDGKLPSPRSEWNVNPGDNYWVCDGLTTANPLNNTVEAIKMGSLWPYTQNVEIYHCPVQPKEFPRSYEINYAMGGDENWGGLKPFRKHSNITQPSERLLFICNIEYLRTDLHRTPIFYPIESGSTDPKLWLDHGISYRVPLKIT
jgi:hypothetical protein